jgi:hypothetical protein
MMDEYLARKTLEMDPMMKGLLSKKTTVSKKIGFM